MRNSVMLLSTKRYSYPCKDHTTCQSINITLNKGKYIFELWGADGGKVNNLQGGIGGYTKGVIELNEEKPLFLNIGAAGYNGEPGGFLKSTFNGGGRGFCRSQDYCAASGGGSTDIRTSPNIEDRIIVAGGGSGAAHYIGKASRNGVYGGGEEGSDGLEGKNEANDIIPGGIGGKQNPPETTNELSGTLLFGGNQTKNNNFGSGGGGGYYGGAAACCYGATGGGGSAYINHELFSLGITINGDSNKIPNFYTGKEGGKGNDGNGGIAITEIIFKKFDCGFTHKYIQNSVLLLFNAMFTNYK